MLTMSREGHIVIQGKHIHFQADQITQN